MYLGERGRAASLRQRDRPHSGPVPPSPLRHIRAEPGSLLGGQDGPPRAGSQRVCWKEEGGHGGRGEDEAGGRFLPCCPHQGKREMGHRQGLRLVLYWRLEFILYCLLDFIELML